MSRNSFRDYFDRVISCDQPSIAMVIQDVMTFFKDVASNGID
jgi:hypothetical protein